MQGPVAGSLVSQRDPAVLSATSKEDHRQVSLQQLFEQLHSSEGGLTSQEARRRQGLTGPNELGAVQRGHHTEFCVKQRLC
jgi:hypothetical protein